MGCMDVSDTVHTVTLRFVSKTQSHSEKIAPCERALKQKQIFFDIRRFFFDLFPPSRDVNWG